MGNRLMRWCGRGEKKTEAVRVVFRMNFEGRRARERQKKDMVGYG